MSQKSHRTAVYTGPGRSFDRGEIERQVQAAAQGQFDALVCLALDHPGPRARVLAIVAEVLTHLGLVAKRSPSKPKARKRRAVRRRR